MYLVLQEPQLSIMKVRSWMNEGLAIGGCTNNRRDGEIPVQLPPESLHILTSFLCHIAKLLRFHDTTCTFTHRTLPYPELYEYANY